MIAIDANALVVLIIGSIDTRLFKTHKRTSIYESEDYHLLLNVIESLDKLVVLPNVWTEVDNLLNNFKGNYKEIYVEQIIAKIQETSEKYLESINGVKHYTFYDLGLTDSLLLQVATETKKLITSDSALSDYAIANGIDVYDLVKEKNNRLG